MWMKLNVQNLNESGRGSTTHWINLEHITSVYFVEPIPVRPKRAINFIMVDSMQWRIEDEAEIQAFQQWLENAANT